MPSFVFARARSFDNMAMENLRVISRREEHSYLPPIFDILDKDRNTIQTYLVWRRDMASWMLDTGELYGIHPSTVEAAQSMLDRLSSVDKDITEDFELYQISSFVCLIIACKNYESRRIFRKSKLRGLIQEFFCQEELDAMERHILYSLQWRIQPPTSIEIAYWLLELVPFEIIPDRSKIMERVTMELKRIMVDSKFLPFRASSKALSSVLISLQDILKSEPFRTIQILLEHALDFKEAFEREREQLQSMLFVESKMSIELPRVGIVFYHRLSMPSYLALRKPSQRDSTGPKTPDASPRSVLGET